MKISKNLENYFPKFRKSVRAHVMQVLHPRNSVFILFPSPDPPDPALVHACQSCWKIRKIWKKMCFLSFCWFRKMQGNCRKIMCFLRNFPYFPRNMQSQETHYFPTIFLHFPKPTKAKETHFFPYFPKHIFPKCYFTLT